MWKYYSCGAEGGWVMLFNAKVNIVTAKVWPAPPTHLEAASVFNSIRTLTTTVNTLSGCRLTSRKAVVYDHWWSILAYFQSQSFTTYTHAGRGERALAQGPNMSHIIKHVHDFLKTFNKISSWLHHNPTNRRHQHMWWHSFLYTILKKLSIASHCHLTHCWIQNTQLDLSIRCFWLVSVVCGDLCNMCSQVGQRTGHVHDTPIRWHSDRISSRNWVRNSFIVALFTTSRFDYFFINGG